MKIFKLFKIASLFALAIAIIATSSCKKSFIEEDEAEESALKSAGKDKKSYIVVLTDNDLTDQLTQTRNYDKKKELVRSTAQKVLNRNGISEGTLEHIYTTAVKGFSIMIPPGQIKKLIEDYSVKYIEEDFTISLNPIINKRPSNPGGSTGDSGTHPPQEIPYGITRVGGGSTYTGSGVAWIIDSGIDLNHPDLNVDQNRSRTFLGGKTTPDDQNGHGTHVAGTIAAIDNNIGVIGVAPGVTVISVRVLDRRGSGSLSGVIDGVDYVAANASLGDVANMSLGGGVSTTLDNAVIAASSKVKFSLAAGNSANDANNHSPARANGANIYTISAMDSNDNWAYFSNYSNPPIDYCAPGVSVKSCYKDGGYATLSGTSMAAPHVAGLLLVGSIKTDGFVNGDPDGHPDPIAHNQ